MGLGVSVNAVMDPPGWSDFSRKKIGTHVIVMVYYCMYRDPKSKILLYYVAFSLSAGPQRVSEKFASTLKSATTQKNVKGCT